MRMFFSSLGPSARAGRDLLGEMILFRGQPIDLSRISPHRGSVSPSCRHGCRRAPARSSCIARGPPPPGAGRQAPPDPLHLPRFPVTDGSDSSRSSSGIRATTDSSLSHKGDLRPRRPGTRRNDAIATSIWAGPAPGGQPLQPQPRSDERPEPGDRVFFADSRSTS